MPGWKNYRRTAVREEPASLRLLVIMSNSLPETPRGTSQQYIVLRGLRGCP